MEKGDTPSSDPVARLEEEIARLSLDKAQCEALIRQLRDRENLRKGIVHAREIFEQQQEKLRLDAEIDIRKKRIRRLHTPRPQDLA